MWPPWSTVFNSLALFRFSAVEARVSENEGAGDSFWGTRYQPHLAPSTIIHSPFFHTT